MVGCDVEGCDADVVGCDVEGCDADVVGCDAQDVMLMWWGVMWQDAMWRDMATAEAPQLAASISCCKRSNLLRLR